MDSRFENGLNSHGNGPPRAKKSVGSMVIASTSKNRKASCLKHYSEIYPDGVKLMLPIITVSEANGGSKKVINRSGKTVYKAEHWTERHKRHKQQKGLLALFLRPHKQILNLPCHIKLTRFAPRKLDKFDNLPMSMKYILDAVCEILTGDYVAGRADSHEGITVVYDQVFSTDYGVLLEIKNV